MMDASIHEEIEAMGFDDSPDTVEIDRFVNMNALVETYSIPGFSEKAQDQPSLVSAI